MMRSTRGRQEWDRNTIGAANQATSVTRPPGVYSNLKNTWTPRSSLNVDGLRMWDGPKERRGVPYASLMRNTRSFESYRSRTNPYQEIYRGLNPIQEHQANIEYGNPPQTMQSAFWENQLVDF